MIKNIDLNLLKDMVFGGAQLLANNRQGVDTLNVFPVPDGDTGTNMSLTMQSAIREVENTKIENLKDIAEAVSRGSLKGARGNSGVILSQILKGFFEVISNASQISTKVFAKALKRATEIAYNAVTIPKEGTILTVIRMTADFAENVAGKNTDFLIFLPLILKKAEEILKQTPEMLPVLKKAGVVDSGGKGLIYIFRGFYDVVAGIEIPIIEEREENRETEEIQADIHDLDNIVFAYCTEFFITNIKPWVTESDIDKLRDSMCSIGDSAIVIGDLYLIKIHVHTNNPDQAIGFALKLGEIDKVKIENMLQQNRALQEKYLNERKPIGLIAVSAGLGLEAIFKDYGVDRIVEGGQSMNPSVTDFTDVINQINAEKVIILPNNKNIIMAAEKSRDLVDKKVIVIPTTSIPEGIAALMAFSPDMSIEENEVLMERAAKLIKVGQVTYAVKNTTVDGFKLKTGDIIGIADKIVAKNGNIVTVLKKTIEKLIDENSEVVTLFYGNGIKEMDALVTQEKIKEIFPNLEINMAYGGQPHYYYFLSVE